MLKALALAFGQLSDPASRRVVWIGVAGAILGFIALAVGIGWALTGLSLSGYAWLDDVLPVAGGLAAFVLAWLFFPTAVVAVSGILIDDVTDQVERRHYPHLAPAPRLALVPSLIDAVRLLAVILAVNLAALPLYILLPGLNLVIFYAANGYLLGREYFAMIANRRLGVADARRLRRLQPGRPFVAGILIAIIASIPVLNLFSPVIAIALMVHVFHDIRHRA